MLLIIILIGLTKNLKDFTSRIFNRRGFCDPHWDFDLQDFRTDRIFVSGLWIIDVRE
uniref:Uncharacterized protein n=1 Tax=Rhizophagus irregularis (strain DAOM 181602 / DAOM 197198 / MUCL 43194) TaxID=747089 RepID=U9TWB3_RHIID